MMKTTIVVCRYIDSSDKFAAILPGGCPTPVEFTKAQNFLEEIDAQNYANFFPGKFEVVTLVVTAEAKCELK